MDLEMDCHGAILGEENQDTKPQTSNQFLIQLRQRLLAELGGEEHDDDGNDGSEIDFTGPQWNPFYRTQKIAGRDIDEIPKREITQINVAVQQVQREDGNEKKLEHEVCRQANHRPLRHNDPA